jgi:hypothetical protein
LQVLLVLLVLLRELYSVGTVRLRWWATDAP